MNRKKSDPPIYHDASNPMSMGCVNCPERELCGGMFAPNGHFSCMEFCQCEDVGACGYVCRRNSRTFALRSMEVRGFNFDNIPHCPVIAPPKLPPVISMLYHSSSRSDRLHAPAVAVKLHKLFNHRTGLLKYASREEIAAKFGYDPNAQIIIVGVDVDPLIEPYWSAGRAAKIYDSLAAIKPDLITTPNFSTFANVPRWDNLHGMKRIAIAWAELVTSGIPTSLHLNARTDRDWERWIEFICERKEIQSVALEFGTGAAVAERGHYHVEKLLKLAAAVPRELQLVIEGGCKYLNELKEAFHEVVFIDTTSYMKTMQRQKLICSPGKRDRWVAFPTPVGKPIDALLQHNVTEVAKSIARSSQARIDLSTAPAVDSIAAGT